MSLTDGPQNMKSFTETLARLPVLNSKLMERSVVGMCRGFPGEVAVRREVNRVQSLTRLERVLVLADVNLGDALLLQPAIGALATALPDVDIDYACHQKMAGLIRPLPELRHTFGLFHGGRALTETTLGDIRRLLADHRYDLILNFCPFLSERQLGANGAAVIGSLPLIVRTLAGHGAGERASLPLRVIDLVTEIVDQLPAGIAKRPTNADATTAIYLERERAEAARFVFERTGSGEGGDVVFVNPDTSNHTTFLGVDFLSELSTRLLESPLVEGLILGRGFTYRGVEDQILAAMGPRHAPRVVLPPGGFTLEDLAALVDRCAVYISGDTGPLHLAAARKRDPGGGRSFTNCTAVIGIFKATDPRIYGYDSHREQFADSSQDAPAWSIESTPSCKNLTCSLQRITGACPAVVCEEELDAATVASTAIGELERRRVEEQLPSLVGSQRRE